ncbi:MAG TPA: hypothetical protein VK169_14720 [Saprospiraceae bacterium]|nr:hypothetical protein [Saprospiraceae bacterium]
MNSAKPILTSLFLIFTFILSAQTYKKLENATIPPSKPYYILPKESFLIEIPVISTSLSKGPEFLEFIGEEILL